MSFCTQIWVEKALVENLLKSLSDAAFILDEDFSVAFCNEAAEEIYGLPGESLLNKKFGEIIHFAENSDIMDKLQEQSIATGQWRGLVEIIDKYGTHRYFDWSLSSFSPSSNPSFRYVLFARGVSDCFQEAIALRESEKQLRAMAEAANDAVMIIDPEGNTSFWNQAAEKIFGYRKDEVYGKNLHRLITPKRLLGLFKKGFANFQKSGKGNAIGKNIELPAKRKNGEEFPVELSLSSINVKGKWHAVGIIRDISTRKKQEGELRAAKAKAEAADKAKSEFLANISHEIRTPMNGILGMLRFLKDSRLNDQQKEWAQMAYHSTESLLALIHDILDFSKFKAGLIKLETISFHLPKLIEEVIQLLLNNATEKGIGLSMDYDLEMPKNWIGDPNHIRQILINLVGNGVKFTHQGSVQISVRGTTKDQNKWAIQIAIKDTGIGVSKMKLEHLFDPFHQVDGSMTRKYGGAGLGLAISRKLTEAMNGEIQVESQEGKGSTFTLTIPLILDQQSKGDERPVEKAKEIIEQSLDAYILLVEDSYVNQQVARVILERFGCKVEIAGNGAEALNRLEIMAFDAVLMDCQMPVMDGYEATMEIRRREKESNLRHLPVIAMTAHALEGAKETCLNSGMDDYLSKPVDPNTLFAILNKWVANEKATQQNSIETDLQLHGEDEKESDTNIFEIDRLVKAVGKNIAFIQKLLIAFLNDVPIRLSELEQGLNEQDSEQVRIAAHTLKGASANIGAERLRQAAYDIEMLAKKNELKPVSQKVEKLHHQYEELRQVIKKIDWNTQIAG